MVNQILFVEEAKKTANINSVVKFFCVVLIIFGIVLVGQGSYAFAKNIAIARAQQDSQIKRPEVTMKSDNENVTFTIVHEKEIDKIKYNWNNGIVNEINANKQTRYSKSIALPTGENTLYITVIDIDGVQSDYKETFKFEDRTLPGGDIEDNIKPTIEFALSDGQKPPLKVTVRDETKIAYMTYRWGDGEEVRVDATNDYFIEQIVEIPEGENTITVVAVDAAGNREEKSQLYKTTTKPKLIVAQTESRTHVNLKAIDNVSVTGIDLYVNGEILYYLKPESETKELEYNLKLPAGQSVVIKLVAHNSSRSNRRI